MDLNVSWSDHVNNKDHVNNEVWLGTACSMMALQSATLYYGSQLMVRPHGVDNCSHLLSNLDRTQDWTPQQKSSHVWRTARSGKQSSPGGTRTDDRWFLLRTHGIYWHHVRISYTCLGILSDSHHHLGNEHPFGIYTHWVTKWAPIRRSYTWGHVFLRLIENDFLFPKWSAQWWYVHMNFNREQIITSKNLM